MKDDGGETMDFSKTIVGIGVVAVGLASFTTSAIFGSLVAITGLYVLANGVKE